MVNVYPKRGIFFLEPVERAREIWRFGTNWLDGEGNDWVWHEHGGLRTMCSSHLVVLLGQYSLRTIEKFDVPSVNVSPDAHSTPKIAQISPGPISSISYKQLKPRIQKVIWTNLRTHLHLVTVHAHQLGYLNSLSGAPMVDELALL